VLLGGAKVSDKISVVERLIQLADCICIGGAMAYTFLAAQGLAVGKSFIEKDHLGVALKLLKQAESMGKAIHLPVDHLVTDMLDVKACVFGALSMEQTIPANGYGIDIGPQTIALYQKALGPMKTIFWNGPMGIFECKGAEKGTKAMIQSLAQSQATTILGGGDTLHALQLLGDPSQMTFVSTGGGASLELLEGKALPGFEALRVDLASP
jgi:phosphoglycerate kinase